MSLILRQSLRTSTQNRFNNIFSHQLHGCSHQDSKDSESRTSQLKFSRSSYQKWDYSTACSDPPQAALPRNHPRPPVTSLHQQRLRPVLHRASAIHTATVHPIITPLRTIPAKIPHHQAAPLMTVDHGHPTPKAHNSHRITPFTRSPTSWRTSKDSDPHNRTKRLVFSVLDYRAGKMQEMEVLVLARRRSGSSPVCCVCDRCEGRKRCEKGRIIR
jgi:hypothetical protein